MKPENRSPATLAEVNRADAITKDMAQTQVPEYHRLLAHVDRNPQSSRALAVYLGRDRMGSIFEVDGLHYAFGTLDEPLRAFTSRHDAKRAVSDAFRRRDTRKLAS